MLPKYLTGVNCVLLVYDVTNRNSFDNLKDWLIVVRQYLDQIMRRETEEAIGKGEKPKDIKVGGFLSSRAFLWVLLQLWGST